jgi:hypothetical protein
LGQQNEGYQEHNSAGHVHVGEEGGQVCLSPSFYYWWTLMLPLVMGAVGRL